MARAPLSSALLKIQRANKHIHDARAAIAVIEGSKNHRTMTHFNARTRKHTVKASFIAEPYEDLVCAAGDAIHNLRSALDHLAWQVSARPGVRAKGVAIDKIAFPVYKSIGLYQTAVKERRIEKVGGADWARFIDALSPYPGGNDLLCALSLADNIDKHREVIRIGAWASSWALKKIAGSRVALGPALFYPLEEEPIVGRYWTTRPDLKADLELTVSVAFTEVGAPYDEPVVAALRKFSKMVEDIIEAGRLAFP